MASVTFSIDERAKRMLMAFPWVNWSEVAREELAGKERAREVLGKLDAALSKSTLTEEDALEIGRRIKESMWLRRK